MTMPMPSNLNDPAWSAFLRSGVSIVVASRDDANRTSLMRAIGGRFDAGSGRFTLLMCVSRSRDLLENIRQNGCVAVVVSRPTTHQTIQLKADDATVEPLSFDDGDSAARYVQSMVSELSRLAFPARFTEALFDFEPDDMAAVRFIPSTGFHQTPGPSAGKPLGGEPCA